VLEALYRKANQLSQEGRYPWAIICFSICYICGNRTQDCIVSLAESFATMGRLRLAMWILQKYDGRYDLQFSIGWVYSLQGDREKAIKIYNTLIEKSTLLFGTN
jgi:tetratricopeptide (TPR) repeat protein